MTNNKDHRHIAFEKLKDYFEWPHEKPDIPFDTHGWFNTYHEEVFTHFLSDETKLVVELGAWLGKSTRYILDNAHNTVIISIDTWLGSTEHYQEDRIGGTSFPSKYLSTR